MNYVEVYNVLCDVKGFDVRVVLTADGWKVGVYLEGDKEERDSAADHFTSLYGKDSFVIRLSPET